MKKKKNELNDSKIKQKVVYIVLALSCVNCEIMQLSEGNKTATENRGEKIEVKKSKLF